MWLLHCYQCCNIGAFEYEVNITYYQSSTKGFQNGSTSSIILANPVIVTCTINHSKCLEVYVAQNIPAGCERTSRYLCVCVGGGGGGLQGCSWCLSVAKPTRLVLDGY